MKIETRNAETFAKNPGAQLLAILIYGPDSGLVRQRAQELARSVVPDLADPFRVFETTADALLSDPARLRDEAAAIALTGGRRVVSVREAGDPLAALLGGFLAQPPCVPPQAALVVIEAGELKPRSALRGLFEGAKNAAALACYADEGAQLSDLIRKTLAAERVSASGEALRYLAENLGGDRMVTLRELEKLAIYAGPGATVDLADAVAVVGDSAALTMDEVAMAAAGGEFAALDRALNRVFLEGAQPVAVLRAVARHFERLRQAGIAVAGGVGDEAAMAALRPAVFFQHKPRFRAAQRRWNAARAADALARLVETEILCKTTGMPAETVCRQALFDLAQDAPRSAERRASV
jgi:DNA polymerase-3 subunit delta